MRHDPRIKEYLYWQQLVEYLNALNREELEVTTLMDTERKFIQHRGSGTDLIFNGKPVMPKQFEIHLPANHIKSCQLACRFCAGAYFNKALGDWELHGLHLLDTLQGAIPQHIYGGAYTEPLMNPYLMTYLAKTREYGNSFGIHTNGVALFELDEQIGFLTELNRIADGDMKSYLQVSLDGALPRQWALVKNTKHREWFYQILYSLERAVEIREKKGKGHAIRLGYLIQPETASPEQFNIFVNTAKEIGVDSVRFSIPFAHYNQTFEQVRNYKRVVELPGESQYEEWLLPLVSKSKDEKPYIFWNYPWFTDIDRFDFNHCVYGYFQITLGADGYFYRCSTVATPTASHLRLAHSSEISTWDDFENLLMTLQQKEFDPKRKCFAHGLRCNRMGLECNTAYAELGKEK